MGVFLARNEQKRLPQCPNDPLNHSHCDSLGAREYVDKSLDIIGYVDGIRMDIWNRFLDRRRPLPLWVGLGGVRYQH